MKYEKYLPIGSIVLLKEGKKKVMITGFCLVKNDKEFDYTGCLYPEGYMSSDKLLLFNHEDIETVYSIGFSDDEEKEFKKKLKDAINKKNNS